jgi:mono/diheme cytochrome c family protein
MKRTEHIRKARSRAASLVLTVAWAVIAALVASSPATAQQSGNPVRAESAAKYDPDLWDIARGGQLYDNWAAALDKELPKKSHPSYPSVGKRKGGVTWRCKECHGWDYMGEDGAYGRGGHYTGTKGIRRMAGKRVEEIIDILTDKTHRYTPEMIPPLAMRKLALFVSKGQIGMDQYIDRATKRARGDVKRGASFFQTVCAICHGFDGAEMVSKSTTEMAAFGDRGLLGTMAATNPWESLHKIRNGQPGVGMVALRVLSVRDQVDVLAYMQTLIRRRYPQ